MYARKVGDQTLTFQVSGMLWKSSLVMRDVETKSLWSHILGEAMSGKLKGTTLEIIPSSMTDWKTWRSRHPDTTIILLKRTANSFTNKMYSNPRHFCLGFVDGEQVRAWGFSDLKQKLVVNDDWNGKQLLVVYHPESGTAMLYDRRVAGRVLHFRWQDGHVVDQETGTQWDWATGAAIEGPLQGKTLTPRTGIVSFTGAWTNFHPQTTFWRPAKSPPRTE